MFLKTFLPFFFSVATTLFSISDGSEQSSAKLTFSTNVTNVTLGSPFTATCSLDRHFASKRFLVSFHDSTKIDLLAWYDVDVKAGSAVLVLTAHNPNLVIHQGKRTSNLTFDLEITESRRDDLDYWCLLVDLESGQKFRSKTWGPSSTQPSVAFNSTAKTDLHRTGVCTIGNLEYLKEKAYNVNFYSNLGNSMPTDVNLLATYVVRPNRITEFNYTDSVPFWSDFEHGSSVSLPTFSIKARLGTVSNGKSWWCSLKLTESGKELMSNAVHLFKH